jgi:hypothetical protein
MVNEFRLARSIFIGLKTRRRGKLVGNNLPASPRRFFYKAQTGSPPAPAVSDCKFKIQAKPVVTQETPVLFRLTESNFSVKAF